MSARRELAEKVAEALVAAGYGRPRTIDARVELDALPVGSVVKYGGTEIPLAAIKNWESKHPRKDGTPLSEWLVTGYVDAFDTQEIGLPAVVLWEPNP